MFEPICYMGWVIQPHPMGFFVYPRVDSFTPASIKFSNFTDAFLYIGKNLIR